MTDADDLGIDDIDVDAPDYPEPDIDAAEVDELKPDSVVVQRVQTDEQVRKRVVSRYAGQLNTIELAKAVKDGLTPLLGPSERGAILEAAAVKLGLDILAENVKPKSVREAAQAIETLLRLQGLSNTGDSVRIPPGARMEIFARVTSALERTTGDEGKLPPITREAIEAVAKED